jgi:hypothetical protein
MSGHIEYRKRTFISIFVLYETAISSVFVLCLHTECGVMQLV